MVIPIFVISLASSILTEILKLFPVLSSSVERKRIVAFIISIVIAVIYLFTLESRTLTGTIEILGGVLAATFLIYKALIQPVKAVIGNPLKKN